MEFDPRLLDESRFDPIITLDQGHRERNLAEYEGEIDVDDQLVEALIRVTELIADKLQE